MIALADAAQVAIVLLVLAVVAAITRAVVAAITTLFAASIKGAAKPVAAKVEPEPPEPVVSEADRFNMRALVTLVRERRAPPVDATGLPFRTVRSERLLLVCHGMVYAKLTTKTEYEGGHVGASVRVVKGLYLRSGRSKGRRVEKRSFDVSDFGTFGLTTKHIYWATDDPASGESFRIRLDKLVAIHAMEGGVHVMRDLASAKPEAFLGGQTGHGEFLAAIINAAADNYGESYDDVQGDNMQYDHETEVLLVGGERIGELEPDFFDDVEAAS